MVSDDYYDVLGVPHDASEKEVRQAYRRRIKMYHPDLNPDLPDAERLLRNVVVAYETLGDRRRRADYDRIIGLFGPRRRIPSPPEDRGVYVPVRSSIIEQRRREARRPVLVWLVLVLVGLLSYLLWNSDVIAYRLFHHIHITPTMYSHDVSRSDMPLTKPAKAPVEDDWNLWYRNLNYALHNGRNGSARDLADAYVLAGRKTAKAGDILRAYRYAAMAQSVDPSYREARELARSLRVRLSAQREP